VVPKLPGICFALLLAIFATGCTELSGTASEPLTPNPQPLTPSLLTPSAQTIDLGIVRQAGREQETFALTNPGTEPVEITKFETSCDCLEIVLPRRKIGPSEKALAVATLDLGKEPQFLGNLAIEVKGLASNGKTAFAIVVEVAVRPSNEFERPSATDH